ncbi:MAG TPA: dihydrofolate reductase [Saprospiraceae bacterium]|nr:dihydrofolate reductase [Saprospiraceae bacterium]
MKTRLFLIFGLLGLVFFTSCRSDHPAETTTKDKTDAQEQKEDFQWIAERFDDKKILRYQVPGFDQLSLQQKKLVYFLAQAGYSGRDIIWDTNYRYNLEIRRALEKIYTHTKTDKTTADWKNFETYLKNVWFSNGIHHHYSYDKFNPKFSQEYFEKLMKEVGVSLSKEALVAMFDPNVDKKKVTVDPNVDIIKESAVNFYDPSITQKEVEDFYKKKMANAGDHPISYGLNSKLVRNPDGSLSEKVWKADGMYGEAIKEIIPWLEKAKTVAENDNQRKGFDLLIHYYKTGDLKTWDDYNVQWVKTTKGDVDYINSFIEVYNDPKGFRGSYESIIEINDFDASKRMSAVASEAQWFEDHSPIMDEHKKKKVVGVSYKVVNVAAESGDASPSTPIGVNLPNANWIRATHGSKSVSLGNLIEAYAKSSAGTLLKEFAYDQAEIDRVQKYGDIADKMHTALHEVIGHASGKLNPGVGTPKETVKNYASALEEARADLVGLYYLMDPKLVELGLIPSLDAGKAAYDDYIRNGIMTQMRRILPGKDLEEAHMRNRQMVALWAYENGKKDNVIEKITRDGKTYFHITDYDKLRTLFGKLLRECQRIKSEGDYQGAKFLFETYGRKLDQDLHKEVLARSKKLNIAPYGGFINPELVPIKDKEGSIIDIQIRYPTDFASQMLDYSKRYGFLPVRN